MKSHRIVVFGDSITKGFDDSQGGWVHRLKRDLENRENSDYSIYNCGISGNNTRDLLKRLKTENEARFLEENDEHIVVFAIGTNDSSKYHENNKYHVPLEEFKENMNDLIHQAQELSTRIIIIGLTSIDENKTTPVSWDSNLSYYQKNVEAYNSALLDIAQDHNLEFVKLLNTVPLDDMEDGLHPNDKGHEKIYQKIKKLFN